MSDRAIRRITRSPEDIAALKSVAERSFTGAFAGEIPDDDMRAYFDTAYSPATLRAEVEDPDSDLFFDLFFVETGGGAVGYIKLNVGKAQTEPMGQEYAELQRIYLLPEAIGGGHGSALIAKAVELAHVATRCLVADAGLTGVHDVPRFHTDEPGTATKYLYATAHSFYIRRRKRPVDWRGQQMLTNCRKSRRGLVGALTGLLS